MKEIIALIIFLSFSIITVYLAVNNQISESLTCIILGFSILSGLAIANYDIVKKFKWKYMEIETFERKVDKIKKDALDKIEKEVDKHKNRITDLTIEANKRKREVEILSKNTLKYAFFSIDPFTGRASTGGGHAEGVSWASPTDIGSLIGKGRSNLNDKKYDLALKAADEIDQIFPHFPGAVFTKFLVYKEMGEDNKAFEFANTLINQISEYGFSDITQNDIADAYKYVINIKTANNQENGAIEVAKKALKHWPDDSDFLNIIK